MNEDMNEEITGKFLGKKIIKYIEHGNVEQKLQRLIDRIPEENRAAIINSHFDSNRDFYETFINASPLFCALMSSHVSILGTRGRIDQTQTQAAVRILLANGADPNIAAPSKEYGHTSLLNISMLGVACHYSDLVSAQMLIDAGADVNAVRDGCSALTVLLDHRSEPSINAMESGAEDNREELLHLLYQHGFNICRTKAFTGHSTSYNDMDFFYYATKALRFAGEFRDYALPIILQHCFRDLDMVEKRIRGNRKLVPKAIYDNYSNMEDVSESEFKKYKKMYDRLIRGNQINTANRIRTNQSDEEYENIYDEIPESFDEPISTENVNINDCKDIGFVAAMKRGNDYIYECVSKENLAYWNSGDKQSNNRNEFNLPFNMGQYKAIKPNWIKSQEAIFNNNSRALSSMLEIPEPKIFLIENTTADEKRDDNRKILKKAQFVGKNENSKLAWLTIPNEHKDDPSEPDFWYYNKITKQSQWDQPTFEGGKKTRRRKIKKNKGKSKKRT